MLNPRAFILLFGAVLALAAHSASALELLPYSAKAADVVELSDNTAEPPYTPMKSNTFFRVAGSAQLWDSADKRVKQSVVSQGGEPVRVGAFGLDSFQYMKNLRLENFSQEGMEVGPWLRMTADEVRTELHGEKQLLHMTNIRIIMYAAANKSALSKVSKQEGGKSEGKGALPPGYDTTVLEIHAAEALMDVADSTGEASGGVELLVRPDENQEPTTTVLCPRVRWRYWAIPALGSKIVDLLALPEKDGDPDPIVHAKTIVKRDDGSSNSIDIEARGMIFEYGVLDHPRTVLNAEGQPIGTSVLQRERAIFHQEIVVNMVGSSSPGVLPFQTPPQPVSPDQPAGPQKPVKPTGPEKPGAAPKAAKKPVGPPEPPSHTVINCVGPGILDLGAAPRAPRVADNALKPIGLAPRFEFFNGVHLVRTPIIDPTLPKPAPVPGVPAPVSIQRTDLTCRHMCIQFPPLPKADDSKDTKDAHDKAVGEGTDKPTDKPSEKPPAKKGMSIIGPEMQPDFAEATGGVKISGLIAPPPGSTDTRPFEVDCFRIYFDSLSDNMIAEGTPGNPATIKDDASELSAQVCVIARKTQQLSMPLPGPKNLKIAPSTMALLAQLKASTEKKPPATDTWLGMVPDTTGAASGGLFDLTSGGVTEINWYGPLVRETVVIPVGLNQPPIFKERVTLRKDVEIKQQGDGGLNLNAQYLRFVRDSKTGNIETLRAHGDVLALKDEMKLKGDRMTIDREYNEKGEASKDLMYLLGDTQQNKFAYLWQGESAVRADSFAIDLLTNSFRAFGGAVARVKMPPPDDAPALGPDGKPLPPKLGPDGKPVAAPAAPKLGPDGKPVATPATPKLGPDGKPVAQAPASASSGFVPGFSLTPGGKIALQGKGDFLFNGAEGTLTVTDDVVIDQEGSFRLLADKLVLNLDNAPPGSTPPATGAKPTDPKAPTGTKPPDPKQPPKPTDPKPPTPPKPPTDPKQAQPAKPKTPTDPKAPPADPKTAAPGSSPAPAGFGAVKSVEAFGHIEISTPTQYVHCDKFFYEMATDHLRLEMLDPVDEVRVYMHDDSGATKILRVIRQLDYDSDKGLFTPGGRVLMVPFKQDNPYGFPGLIPPNAPAPETPKPPTPKPPTPAPKTPPASEKGTP